MNKIIKFVAIIMVVILLSGCFGNFQLTRNLYTWNSQVGDKFVNTAVMWVLMIVPVYGVCGFIDLFVLNTIEFWTGDNPLTMSEGEMDIKQVENDGKLYEIKATKNRFDITQLKGEEAGSTVAIIYDPADLTWYLESESQKIRIAEVENGFLTLNYPDGSKLRTDLHLN